MQTDDLIMRIRVQSGMAEIPEGEPEPWSNTDKLKGPEPKVGSLLLIEWDIDDWPRDKGYVFTLPVEPEEDVGAVVVIPDPWCVKEASEPMWSTLADLLNNPHVRSVEAIGGGG